MNKTNVILICIIIALVFGIMGYMLGINSKSVAENINTNNAVLSETVTESSTVVGTYKTNTWNGKEGFLVIKNDGTMIYPTGNRCTWVYEDGRLFITSDTGEKTQELELVDKGIMINTHFFQKID